MTVPPRNRLGAVLAMLAAGCAIARAQGPEIALPTAERTALIAELQAGSFRLLTTPDEAAIGPVVDLLITAREVPAALRHAGILALVEARRPELAALWRLEPARRRARTALFRLLPELLLRRYAAVAASDPEAADLRAVAPHADRSAFFAIYRDGRDHERRAAAALLAAGHRAALRAEPADDATGFAAARRAAETDGIAALDAIALLRRRLGLQPLPWHTIARAVAPATGEAAAWPAGSEWSTEASERAELWLQAGQRAVELGGRDDLARTCFDSALACGSEGVLTFLAGLVQAAQPRLVEAMLAAGRPLVDRGPLPPPDHGRADQSYAELLDHDDVRVVSFAAERALWLIRSGSAGVALTNAVIARARPAIVPGNAGLPVAGVVPVVRTWYCGGIPPHIDPTAACIFAACFTGDPAVAEALQALPAAAKTPGSLFVACDTAIARFPNGVPRRTADTLASAAEVAARVAAGIAHGRDRTRAALTETAVTPTWSASLERRVLDATGDDDPEVRLAAYRALATLDAELWPSRGLLHETRFDPDPRIRALRP